MLVDHEDPDYMDWREPIFAWTNDLTFEQQTIGFGTAAGPPPYLPGPGQGAEQAWANAWVSFRSNVDPVDVANGVYESGGHGNQLPPGG